jgi:hypothetical protein
MIKWTNVDLYVIVKVYRDLMSPERVLKLLLVGI